MLSTVLHIDIVYLSTLIDILVSVGIYTKVSLIFNNKGISLSSKRHMEMITDFTGVYRYTNLHM